MHQQGEPRARQMGSMFRLTHCCDVSIRVRPRGSEIPFEKIVRQSSVSPGWLHGAFDFEPLFV